MFIMIPFVTLNSYANITAGVVRTINLQKMNMKISFWIFTIFNVVGTYIFINYLGVGAEGMFLQMIIGVLVYGAIITYQFECVVDWSKIAQEI